MARASSRARIALLAILSLTAVALIVVAAVYAASSDDEGTPSPVHLGPSYTEGIIGTWRRVNPLFATTEFDRDLVQLVFRGLVELGPDGSIEPGLANLPSISDDGKRITFFLQEDLKWSDGAPLTSGDIAFTIGLLQAPDFRGDGDLAQAWSGVLVETPDPETVIVTLEQSHAPFVARFATLGILPRHLLANASAMEAMDDPFNSRPIGAGPFAVKRLDSDRVHLVPNPHFAGDAPEISELKFQFFSDQLAALNGLLAGEIDGLAVRNPLTELETTMLSEAGFVRRFTVQRSASIVLFLNNDQTLFDDPRVRRAVSLIIDRATLSPGQTVASTSPVAPATWGYKPEFDDPEVDFDEAQRLLSEAGWEQHGTSGILTKEGSEFRLTLRVDSDPERVAMASEAARQLQVVGIRANVASTSFAVLFRDFLQERNYQAAVVAWDPGADPDPYDSWHSSQMGAAGLNLANFADPVTDELISLGRTRSIEIVRLDAYRQFQERWEEMTPSIILGYSTFTYLLSGDIEPSLPAVLFSLPTRFADIEHWQK